MPKIKPSFVDRLSERHKTQPIESSEDPKTNSVGGDRYRRGTRRHPFWTPEWKELLDNIVETVSKDNGGVLSFLRAEFSLPKIRNGESLDLFPIHEKIADEIRGEGNAPLSIDSRKVDALLSTTLKGQMKCPRRGGYGAEFGIQQSDLHAFDAQLKTVLSMLLTEPLLALTNEVRLLAENPELVESMVKEFPPIKSAGTGGREEYIEPVLKKSRVFAMAKKRPQEPYYLSQLPLVNHGLDDGKMESYPQALVVANELVIRLINFLENKSDSDTAKILGTWTLNGQNTSRTMYKKERLLRMTMQEGVVSTGQILSQLLMSGVVEEDGTPITDLSELGDALAATVGRLSAELPFGFVQPVVYRGYGLSEPLTIKRGMDGSVRTVSLPKGYREFIRAHRKKREDLSTKNLELHSQIIDAVTDSWFVDNNGNAVEITPEIQQAAAKALFAAIHQEEGRKLPLIAADIERIRHAFVETPMVLDRRYERELKVFLSNEQRAALDEGLEGLTVDDEVQDLSAPTSWDKVEFDRRVVGCPMMSLGFRETENGDIVGTPPPLVGFIRAYLSLVEVIKDRLPSPVTDSWDPPY